MAALTPFELARAGRRGALRHRRAGRGRAVAEVLGLDAKAPFRVFNHARERGVLVRPLGDGVALSPPLIATREHIDTAASAIGEALDAVASELGVTAAA